MQRIIKLSLFCVAGLLAAMAPVSRAQTETEPRPIQLAWFPRFSPDGEWLASAHGRWDQLDRGELRIRHARTGQDFITYEHARGVRTVAWAPKSKRIVTGCYGGDIHTFDTDTGKRVETMRPGSQVENLLITPDEKSLISTHGTGSVILFDFVTREQTYKWERIHQGGIWGVSLSHDGKLLATAGQDGFVRVFDLAAKKVLQAWPHPRSTNGVTFTRDARRLATGCNDGLIRVFDVATGAERNQVAGHEPNSGITELRFTKDDGWLFSAGMDRTIRRWKLDDAGAATLMQTVEAHDGFVFGLDLSPDETQLASAGWDNVVKVWKAADLELVWRRPE
jgi:WD40 repeat protein